MRAKWGFLPDGGNGPSSPPRDRLKKLAKSLDALARQDENVIRRAREIGSVRRQAALELHGICGDFVRDLNQLLSAIELEFHPEEYAAENFQDNGINLFQINARGRILQIKFEATPELVSTEDFRVPYILAGAVRCFNQQLLEKDLIEEQLLFYTIEKSRKLWRFFDSRTYRSGPFDADYLIGLMEQLV
ncbi:MAG TPA: hypothetical protein VKR61_16010 [Bryobacteraceae bacterium]|nr:hypothetical protein [Bryobacteraceae bacterium]